jgi:hypothetical protein
MDSTQRRDRRGRPASFFSAVALAMGLASAPSAHAADTYNNGYISNITFSGDEVLVMLSTGVPTNCTGTPYGWMRIPPEYKSMTAFVIGLWMRGDMSSTNLTLYTGGLGGNGYCVITQIDPAN